MNKPKRDEVKIKPGSLVLAAWILFTSFPCVAAKYNIKAQEDQEGTLIAQTFTCTTDAFCGGTFPCIVDGLASTVKIAAIFHPGDAYFQFAIGDTILFAGEQDELHIPFGQHINQTVQVHLFRAGKNRVPDAANKNLHFPLLQSPGPFVAALHLTIQDIK